MNSSVGSITARSTTGGSPTVASTNFDFTLMICLLRNISGINAPVRGFDALPLPAETSEGSDLARIKYYRNKIAHSEDSKLSNRNFNDAWKDVSEALIRLGRIAIKQKCANSKICSLDSSFCKQLLLDLKFQEENLNDLTEKMEKSMVKVESSEHAYKFTPLDPVPRNIRDRNSKVISDWKSSDERFIETNSSKQLLQVLKKNQIVIVIGNSGIGKTFTSRHVALEMIEEGYDVLTVKSPKDVTSYSLKNRKSLFLFDDICGRYNVIQSESEEWDRCTPDIHDCFTIAPFKILATCRLHVFQNPILQGLEILTQCQFNMSSEKYATTVPEKRSIAGVYISQEYTKRMSEEYIQKYDYFPLLCSMVSKFQEGNVIDFIGNPYNYFEKELDKMLITAGMNYCALLSVAVFNGKLSEKLLDDKLSEKEKAAFVDIFDVSMQNTNTSRTLLKNHLNVLLGVYITKLNDIYAFIHDKIFDIACLYFSKKCMNCFVEHGDILLLCERFEFDYSTQTDDVQRIVVPESLEEKYFHRMLNDVTDLTFLDIFGCKQMNNKIFRKRFLHTLALQKNELISKLLNFSELGINLLHLMCNHGDIEMVKFCISKGMDINKCDDIGISPLHLACKYGYEHVVDVLLHSGVKVNCHGHRGFTPLYAACCTGQTQIVEKLLKSGARPNVYNKRGIFPLTVSAKNGNVKITQLLLQYKSDVNKQNNDGISALHEACMNQWEDIVNILLEHGADINLKTNNNETPLYFACKVHNYRIIDIFISKGAGETALNIACSEGFKTIAEQLLNKKANIHGSLKHNQNPLQLACLNQHPAIVNMLISRNVDCNYISCSSTFPFPLHISCMRNDYESIEALVEAHADVNQISEVKSSVLSDFKCKEDTNKFFTDTCSHNKIFMITPLDILCMAKSLNLRTVMHLLEHNARPNIKSANGIHPLLVACFYEYNDLISILLKNEANINTCDNIDTLCLAYMQYNGEEDIIDILSYADFATSSKSTSLHIASMNNSDSMVNKLLQNQARRNIACNISPFLLAIQNGNYQMTGGTHKMVVHYYNELGVIKDILPIHAACLSGYTNVVKILVKNTCSNYVETAIGISSAQVACINGYVYPDNPDMIKQHFVLTPLQIACLGQYWDIFKILMHKKVNFIETFDVSTNLIACFSGNNKKINESLNDTKIYQTSVLWLSAIHEQNDIAKYILDTILNADLEVSKSLKKLFLCACSNGNLELVSHLYSKLVDLNIIEIDNDNALYPACVSCHRDVAEFLVSNCMCTESATPDNEVPLPTAYRTRLDNIVELLLSDVDDSFLIKDGINAFLTTSKYNQADILREFFALLNTNVYLKNIYAEHFLDRDLVRGKNVLYFAYLNKNANLIKLIVSFGANINSTYGERNDTLLMKACKDNDIQLTKLLLENSPNLDIRNKEGQTALCISSARGEWDIAELLVNCGANVNISSYKGLSPLYFACIQQQIDSVKLLLQNQADTSGCLPHSESLLMICCMSKAYEIVDLLLQYGADVNQYCSGRTALYKSLQMADFKLTKSLLAYNADLKKIRCLDLQMFFIEACKKGCVDFVQIIIQRDESFDVNAALVGKTPLYACYEALSSSQYTSQIKTGLLLLQHGADLFVSTNGNDTAFHQLCTNGNLSDIKEVLENCPINQTSLAEEFAHACANNRNELACLFNEIVRRHLSTDNMHNIFFLAAKYGMDDIVEDVLHSNIDLNSENVIGQTALHIACSKGNDSIVEKLLACGKVDINKQSDNGYTALHFACCNGHTLVIQILLNNGAAMNIRSYLDETIVDVATKLHVKVIDILLYWNMEETIEQLLEHSSIFLKAYYSSCSIQSILRQHLISVDPNSFVNNTESPLHIACMLSDDELIDQLIDNPKVDVDCISKFGVTPLLLCVCNHDLRNTKSILESGASVNKMTNILKHGLQQLFGHTTASLIKDITPLSFACFVQNCDIIQILIEQNANICSPIHICYCNLEDCSECETLTPLCVSVMQNNLDIVKLLVNNVLETVSPYVNYVMVGSLYENYSMTEEQFLKLGRIQLTAFQVACVLQNMTIASYLVEETRADINGTFIITPIFLSLYVKCNALLIRIMSKHKIENKMFQTGVTPLIFSALVDDFNLMTLLLKNHANLENDASLTLLHIIALNNDILNVFECNGKVQDLKLECTVSALLICCLKDNEDMCNTLLKQFVSQTSSSEITALHAVCLKGLVNHLRLFFENGCHCKRHFSIQSNHLISIYGDLDGFNLALSSLISTCLNLHVTFTELACLISNNDTSVCLLSRMSNDNDVMELSPLMLSFLSGNKDYLQLSTLLSSPFYGQCSVISNACNIVWLSRQMANLSVSFPDDLHKKQYITDISVRSLACFYSFISTDDDDHLFDTLLLNDTIEVQLFQIIGFDLIFLEIDNDDLNDIINSLLPNLAAMNDILKINNAYLILLRNKDFHILSNYAYIDIALDLLQFSLFEISYLVNKHVSLPFLNSMQTAKEKATVSQLMVACLHRNTPNVKCLCSMGKSVQNSKMTIWDLLAFFSREDMFEKNIPIMKAISNRNLYGLFNELHIACLMGNKEIIKTLLRNINDIDARSYVSPLHISIICDKLRLYDENEFLSAIKTSRRGLDIEYLADTICLPMELNVLHLICFLYDIEFLRILIRIKCDLRSIAKIPTLFLYYIDMLNIDAIPNILSAVSEMTPLHIACMLEKEDFVDSILLNTNYIDVLCSIHPLHLNTKYSKDISELITDKSSFTITALHVAILCENTDIAKTLITNDADTENTAKLFIELCIGTDTLICTHSTLKPLHLACLVENEAIFKTILAKTSISNLNEKVKMSYFHLCYLNLQEEANSSGTLGYDIEMRINILHMACIIGENVYAELLLNANVDTNSEVDIFLIHSTLQAEFSVRKYPLHLSAEKGNFDLCKLLLDHGANIDVTTSVLGLQPWHLALYHGYADVLDCLLTNNRSTYIDKSRFMFIFMLYLMRKRFSRVILPFIANSRKCILFLSVYRYLRYVLLFPVNNKCDYTTDDESDEYNYENDEYNDESDLYPKCYDEHDEHDENVIYDSMYQKVRTEIFQLQRNEVVV